MPGAKWYSQPDRPDKRALGAFDPTAVADDEVRKALERIQQDLRFLQETCPNGMPVYGLRAHCWNPDLTRNVYGAHNAHFNTTVLSYPLNGNRNVWLPDAQARPGGYVEIVDASGTASTTNITVKTLKGQKVNGASTYAISTSSAAVCFRSTGEGWVAIAVSSGGNASDPLSTAVTAASTFGTTDVLLRSDGLGRGAKAAADKMQARVFRNTSTQTIGAATWTKVQFNGETFDTQSVFDSATNFRYTPTKAGKYTVRARLLTASETASGDIGIAVYKNGSAVAYGVPGATQTNHIAAMVADEQDMNGSSDFLEIYIYSTAGTEVTNGTAESYASFERVD